MSDSRTLRTLRLVAASLVALVSLTLLASAASAQTNETCTPGGTVYGGTIPTVCGTNTVPEPPKTTTPTVLGTTQTRGMAFTGGDIVGIVALGGGAVVIGTALVLAARRRRSLELA